MYFIKKTTEPTLLNGRVLNGLRYTHIERKKDDTFVIGEITKIIRKSFL